MGKYTLEHRMRIYNDDDGEYIEISPDPDGLDLVEIRQVDRDGKIYNRVSMNKQMALLFIDAFTKYVNLYMSEEEKPVGPVIL